MVETYKLTRKNMADLLMALSGQISRSPQEILMEAWGTCDPSQGMPSILVKVLDSPIGNTGFSLNEIVSLGNQIEFTNFPQSTVQNWVKRDVRALIGSPLHGKKYTTTQAAMLFIVEDLKGSLDFESIRGVLTLVFNNIEDRHDDIINPIELYSAYASVFDRIHHHALPTATTAGDTSVNEAIDQFIQEECRSLLPAMQDVTEEDLTVVWHVLIVAAMTVQSAYYQATAKNYVKTALDLRRTVDLPHQ